MRVFVVTAIFAVMRDWFVVYSFSLHWVGTGTPEEEILNTLKCNGLHHFIHTNPEKNLQCISWASPAQIALLTALGEVLMLDATYKVNNTRLPLFTLAIVDSHGHGQPVAHGLVAREDEEHLRMFLNDVATWEPAIKHATFITDKDMAEINAVKHVCSDAHIFLCRFHIMKAFNEELRRQPCDDSELLLSVSIIFSAKYHWILF